MDEKSPKSQILIIDDDPVARKTLELLLLPEGYQLFLAEDGAEGLQLAYRIFPDLILLDVILPDVDGISVLHQLRSEPALAEVPVLLISSLDDNASRLIGLEAGADDFVNKPFAGLELRARVRTITRLNRYRKLSEERQKLEQSHVELQQAYENTLMGWSRMLELRDKETQGHTQRVTDLTIYLAHRLGITGDALDHIRRGAILHDIGKIGIPDKILLKDQSLTEDEWQIMQRHPEIARDALANIDYLLPALDIPYSHHEHWDGSGYPLGLKGEAIPLAARIFAVIDVWDALLHDRPYRDGWEIDHIAQYMRTQSGKYFDPTIISVFLDMVESKEIPIPELP